MKNKPVIFDKIFVKHYKKRVKVHRKLHTQYKKMLALFFKDPHHPQLRNHKLKGKLKEYRAFFIDDDCRVMYSETRNEILFLDVGKHEEVYKK